MLIFIKMKKKYEKEIEIPEDVEVKLNSNLIFIKGPEGENSRELKIGKARIEIKDNKIRLFHDKASKKEKKLINTNSAHISNMIKGVKKKFEYKLKICFGHFPFTLKIEEKRAIVKNFLGEKVERITFVPQEVEIEIDKEIITVKSVDKEKAGQTAARLETLTRIKGRDKRIFQDGIYITNKAGKEI